jgi:putative tryptophan/tyrosine transport system substrate-binding protein
MTKTIGVFINLADNDKEVAFRLEAFMAGVTSVYANVALKGPVYGAGAYQSYQRLANDLMEQSPDIFFCTCGPSMWALQIASKNTKPIVFAGVLDPTNTAVMKKGYNQCTGVISYLLVEQTCLLTLLHGFNLTNVGVLYDPGMRAGTGQLGAILTKAQEFGMSLVPIDIRQTPGDIESDVSSLANPGGGAPPQNGLMVLTGSLAAAKRDSIIALAAKYNLPAIYPNSLYCRSGGFMSYGPYTRDLYQSAGIVAGGILLNPYNPLPPPVMNKKFEFCINIPIAIELNLPVPDDLRCKATTLIE